LAGRAAEKTIMQESITRSWRWRDRSGWRNFGIAMLALSISLIIALFSAAVAQEGRIWLASISTLIALGIAAWVTITIVPALAKGTNLRVTSLFTSLLSSYSFWPR
jgi:Kef-type K+ transport system membrane component KefB